MVEMKHGVLWHITYKKYEESFAKTKEEAIQEVLDKDPCMDRRDIISIKKENVCFGGGES